MKILVTGCAGFIGFHLVRRLLMENHDVTGVDNLNNYYSPALKKRRLKKFGINFDKIEKNKIARGNNGFLFIYSDILNPALYNSLLKDIKFDIICNLAAQVGVQNSISNPHQYINSNIQGFHNILEYCRKRPDTFLIFASSSSVYGANKDLPFKETDSTDFPLSLYAATKKSNELIACSYSNLFNIRMVGLRFFTVYGPWGRPDMIPFLFTESIINNRPIKIFNNGRIARDFTYVEDVIEALYKVIEARSGKNPIKCKQFCIYNIANSKPVAIEEFISQIEKITAIKAKKEYEPKQLGDIDITWGDTSLFEQDFGYKPMTTIERGLKEFVSWYKNFYNV